MLRTCTALACATVLAGPALAQYSFVSKPLTVEEVNLQHANTCDGRDMVVLPVSHDVPAQTGMFVLVPRADVETAHSAELISRDTAQSLIDRTCPQAKAEEEAETTSASG
jgi:hypothetical protein